MSSAPNPYEALLARLRDLGRLQQIEALLDWDQETYMPTRGVDVRAEQSALISGLAHDQLVASETGDLLAAAEAQGTVGDDPDAARATNLREFRRVYDRQVKLPTELVKQISATGARAKSAWAQARQDNDYPRFAPFLAKLIELKREVAQRVGAAGEPYDALMDEFEPGATVAVIEPIFAELRPRTVELLQRLQSAPRQPDPGLLTRNYPVDAQRALSLALAAELGFDFDAGRVDVSTHPFTTTIGGPTDVRFTTRYHDDFFPAGIFGTMHETGHALYEQGLPAEHVATPRGSHVSLGIHESQSRLWENQVGRGRPFWECVYPRVRQAFPAALGDVELDAFYAAINCVQPSFIRVEADELTYNLHIVLRFEIERALFTGRLEVADVPAAWNEQFQQLLGLTPPSDAQGCLQDVHWAMGIFGYFPTYALGNLYAAQFFARARQDLPQLDDHIRSGEHGPLLAWLRERIHQHGQRYRAHELVERVTGEPLSLEPFMNYVTEKFSAVYGV